MTRRTATALTLVAWTITILAVASCERKPPAQPPASPTPAVTPTPMVTATSTPTPDLPAAEIEPGKGVGPIRIGDPPAAVKAILGEPEAVTQHAEEERRWKGFGYDTSVETPFVVGFDYLWQYSPAKNKTRLPIWKVYFRKEKVALINVSGYVYEDAGPLRLGKDVELGSPIGKAKEALGPQGLYTYSDDYQNVCYFTRGIELVAEGGVVKNIIVYPPMSPNVAALLQTKLNAAESPSPTK